jgi:glutamate racemase
MIALPDQDRLSLLLTDSGLGGLSICADLVNRLSGQGNFSEVRLTYFNAWPEQARGYNRLPDMAERIRVFDRALGSMDGFGPDAMVIACNTLSVLYPQTPSSRTRTVPVVEIVGAGVDLMHQHLRAQPQSRVLILGTVTTIESDVHRRQLVARGIAEQRIATQPCHGVAGEIENDPMGQTVRSLVERYCAEAVSRLPDREAPLLAALCCTHFPYSRSLFQSALQAHHRGPVVVLDPNRALVDGLLGGQPPRARPGPSLDLQVVSRIAWSDRKVEAISRALEPVSPLVARALRQYRHDPSLFTF